MHQPFSPHCCLSFLLAWRVQHRPSAIQETCQCSHCFCDASQKHLRLCSLKVKLGGLLDTPCKSNDNTIRETNAPPKRAKQLHESIEIYAPPKRAKQLHESIENYEGTASERNSNMIAFHSFLLNICTWCPGVAQSDQDTNRTKL